MIAKIAVSGNPLTTPAVRTKSAGSADNGPVQLVGRDLSESNIQKLLDLKGKEVVMNVITPNPPETYAKGRHEGVLGVWRNPQNPNKEVYIKIGDKSPVSSLVIEANISSK